MKTLGQKGQSAYFSLHLFMHALNICGAPPVCQALCIVLGMQSETKTEPVPRELLMQPPPGTCPAQGCNFQQLAVQVWLPGRCALPTSCVC